MRGRRSLRDASPRGASSRTTPRQDISPGTPGACPCSRIPSCSVRLHGPSPSRPPLFRMHQPFIHMMQRSGDRNSCGYAGGPQPFYIKVRSGPMSRVLSWTIIYLRMPLPAPSSAQPERGAGHTIALLFAFAPEGACQAAVLPRRWWSLAPPFQLFSHLEEAAGVFFSAALSVGSPRLAVSQLPALWSPDFPHDPKGPAIVWPTSQERL